MNDIVLFTHVNRTGGMAAFEYLRETIGMGAGREQFETIVPRDYTWPHIQIMITHMPYGVHHFFGGRRSKYVTMLREPADRMASHYFSDHQPARTFDTWVEEIRAGRYHAVDNMMTRMLRYYTAADLKQGYSACIYERPVTWEDLEAAKYNLENKYLFVGTTEWWQESIAWICNYYGWQEPPNKRHTNDNRSKLRDRGRTMPGDVMETIYRREVFDAQLYQFGKNLATDYLWR